MPRGAQTARERKRAGDSVRTVERCKARTLELELDRARGNQRESRKESHRARMRGSARQRASEDEAEEAGLRGTAACLLPTWRNDCPTLGKRATEQSQPQQSKAKTNACKANANNQGLQRNTTQNTATRSNTTINPINATRNKAIRQSTDATKHMLRRKAKTPQPKPTHNQAQRRKPRRHMVKHSETK